VIRFLKAPPTTYVMQFKNGKVKREGPGLSFFYWAPTTTLVMVPLASADVPFAFQEVTSDFQALTVQGQLTFRVADPKKLASLLDFETNAAGQHLSEDPQKIPDRLVHAAQVLARAAVQSMPLKQALARSDALSSTLLAQLRGAEAVTSLGVEVLALSVLSMKPAPEMGRALEAYARESLQREADAAIYDRRKAAVEEERKIKESELATQVMVEEKRRHIRETQMAADISVEEKRAQLIDQKVENEKKSADSKAYSLEVTLKPIKALDWKTLQALSAGGGDPRTMIALAFREMAENAERIGELNMSPDLLRTLLGPEEKPVNGKG